MTILATDPFTGTGGAALGANWTTTTTESAPTLVSNEAVNNVGGGGGARYTAISWPNDQFSEILVGSVVSTTTDEGVGPACRIASGAKTHYLGQTNTVQTRLYKVVAGTFTQLGSDGPACATGDLLRLICNGQSISLTKNGVTIVGPISDAAIGSGDAGIWGTQAGGPGTINSFTAGDLIIAAGVVISSFHPGASPGLGGISSMRFQPSNWWPYSPPALISFDPALMSAMGKYGNDPLVLPPQVVASGMTPPDQMPT